MDKNKSDIKIIYNPNPEHITNMANSTEIKNAKNRSWGRTNSFRSLSKSMRSRNKNNKLNRSASIGSLDNEECSIDTKTGVPPMPVGAVVEEDGRINYFPNCDAKVWIRTCEQPVTTPITGIKTGTIPLWLKGSLIRNGPGRIKVGNEEYKHIFDGSAILHRFYIKDGEATYQNKFLHSDSYLKDTKAQRIVVNYFGTRAHPDPCKTILKNIASKFTLEEHFTDNAQISIYPYGDGLYALTETPYLHKIDPVNLDTLEKEDLTKHVAVLNHTAHPHVESDGSVYNIGQSVGPFGPKYLVCKFPKTKLNSKGKKESAFEQVKVVASCYSRWFTSPCYMHSFCITQNYFIIIEQPMVVTITKFLKVLIKKDAIMDCLDWNDKELTKFIVIRRDTGATTTISYLTDTFFFLHTINAYEQDGHIIMDVSVYKDPKMLNCMYVDALKDASYDPTYAQMFRGRPKRWVIPLNPSKPVDPNKNLVTLANTKCTAVWVKKGLIFLKPELLADVGCEVPRINYEVHNGRPYKYFYAICSDIDKYPRPGALIKVDVEKKDYKEWSEDNVYPSEPIFIPHPEPKSEDDGVVLSALLRCKGLDNQVCLLILDAKSFTEIARVEFETPSQVPKCLHGWFVPDGTFS